MKLKVGDWVRIKDNGGTCATYRDMATKLKATTWGIDMLPKNNSFGMIKAIDPSFCYALIEVDGIEYVMSIYNEQYQRDLEIIRRCSDYKNWSPVASVEDETLVSKDSRKRVDFCIWKASFNGDDICKNHIPKMRSCYECIFSVPREMGYTVESICKWIDGNEFNCDELRKLGASIFGSAL